MFPGRHTFSFKEEVNAWLKRSTNYPNLGLIVTARDEEGAPLAILHPHGEEEKKLVGYIYKHVLYKLFHKLNAINSMLKSPENDLLIH